MRDYFRAQWGLVIPDQQTQTSDSPLADLLQSIDHTRERALARHQEYDEEALKEAELRRKNEHIEAQRQQLLNDILELHQRVKSGFTESSLQDLRQFLQAHCQHLAPERKAHHLGSITLDAIVDRIENEALLWGWQQFSLLQQAHQLPWPAPLGLGPSATAADVESHRAMDVDRLRDGFLRGPVRRFADLIVGIVPGWGERYPERGGPVWVHSVYESLAAALAGRRLETLDALAQQYRTPIEERLNAELSPLLLPLQEKLATSRDAGEASRLTNQLRESCQQAAPALVWAMLSEYELKN